MRSWSRTLSRSHAREPWYDVVSRFAWFIGLHLIDIGIPSDLAPHTIHANAIDSQNNLQLSYYLIVSNVFVLPIAKIHPECYC